MNKIGKATVLFLALLSTTFLACYGQADNRGMMLEDNIRIGDKIRIEPMDPAKTVTTASGLKYEDLRPGIGETPKKGQKLTVDYMGRLEDGTVFDTSKSRHKPFVYYHQLTQLIAGWTEGVSTMKVGGKRRLLIPPRLGYGSEGAGDKIPPNATLVFDIELLRADEIEP